MVFRENPLDLFGERLLDPGQVACEVRLDCKRVGEKMDVLRHEDEGNQLKLELRVGLIQAPREFFLPNVVGQQGSSLIAGERKLMEMARFVIVPNCLPMRHGGVP